MIRFISVVVVAAALAAVSLRVSAGWMSPVFEKSHRVVHEAVPYPDGDRDQSMNQRDRYKYRERATRIPKETGKSRGEDTSAEPQGRQRYDQDLNSH